MENKRSLILKLIIALVVIVVLIALGFSIFGKDVSDKNKPQEVDQVKVSVDPVQLSDCSAVDMTTSKDECFIKVAIKVKDVSICDNISSSEYKNRCRSFPGF